MWEWAGCRGGDKKWAEGGLAGALNWQWGGVDGPGGTAEVYKLEESQEKGHSIGRFGTSRRNTDAGRRTALEVRTA